MRWVEVILSLLGEDEEIILFSSANWVSRDLSAAFTPCSYPYYNITGVLSRFKKYRLWIFAFSPFLIAIGCFVVGPAFFIPFQPSIYYIGTGYFIACKCYSTVTLTTLSPWQHCHHENTVTMTTLSPWQHCYHDNTVTMTTLLPWQHCYHDNTVTMSTLSPWQHFPHDNTVAMSTLSPW